MSVVIANEVTYNGIKQFEMRIEGDPTLNGATLVCKQDYRGAKTWRVVHQYYATPKGETMPVRHEETLAIGLTRRQAKQMAIELLTRSVVGVEPGGKLRFWKRGSEAA